MPLVGIVLVWAEVGITHVWPSVSGLLVDLFDSVCQGGVFAAIVFANTVDGEGVAHHPARQLVFRVVDLLGARLLCGESYLKFN